MNLERSKDGSTQLLPQFRDTKLSQLRFWSQPAPSGTVIIQNESKTFALCVIVDVILFVTGIVLIVSAGLLVPGLVILGVCAVMTLSGIACSIVICVRSRKAAQRKSDALQLRVLSSDDAGWEKFPFDPVMSRSVTRLVFHGQDDCEECRSLRLREESQRKYDWPLDEDSRAFPFKSLPCASTKEQKSITEPFSGSQKKIRPVISKACVTSDTRDHVTNTRGPRFNNNSVEIPVVVITPPKEGERTSSSAKRYSKRTQARHDVISTRSSVTKKRRGLARASLKRMKLKSRNGTKNLDSVAALVTSSTSYFVRTHDGEHVDPS